MGLGTIDPLGSWNYYHGLLLPPHNPSPALACIALLLPLLPHNMAWSPPPSHPITCIARPSCYCRYCHATWPAPLPPHNPSAALTCIACPSCYCRYCHNIARPPPPSTAMQVILNGSMSQHGVSDEGVQVRGGCRLLTRSRGGGGCCLLTSSTGGGGGCRLLTSSMGRGVGGEGRQVAFRKACECVQVRVPASMSQRVYMHA